MAAPLRILHLEDDPADAELVGSRLAHDGCDCRIDRVWTREDFCAAIAGCAYDLILADMNLPSFDGPAALALARERHPGIPFVFVTGSVPDALRGRVSEDGATLIVSKDRLSDLAPVVRRLLPEK